jgi:hypothetical protein
MNKMTALGERLVDELEQFRALPESEREPDFDDAQLNYAIQLLKDRIAAIESNALPPRDRRYRTLGRMVTELRPIGTDLGDRLIEFESRYIAM